MFIASAATAATTGTSVWTGESFGLERERPLVVGRDISPSEAARLIAEGLLARCVADVVVYADAWLDVELRAECLGLVMRRERVDPDDWVVGHATAAWVHRGTLTPARERVRGSGTEAGGSWAGDASPALDQVVVLGPRGRSARYAGVVVHRQATLADDEIIVVSGIRVTSAVRTAADLLRLLPASEARGELDRLAAATSVTAEAVDAALARRQGVRGLTGARCVLRAWATAQGREPT